MRTFSQARPSIQHSLWISSALSHKKNYGVAVNGVCTETFMCIFNFILRAMWDFAFRAIVDNFSLFAKFVLNKHCLP